MKFITFTTLHGTYETLDYIYYDRTLEGLTDSEQDSDYIVEETETETDSDDY